MEQMQEIAQKYRDLAENPANRRIIVKDHGSLPALVLFLDNEDVEVVRLAVETLYCLAQCAENQEDMRKELGLIVSLRDITRKPKMLQEISLLAHATINSVAVVSDNSRQPLGEIQTPNTFFKGRVNKMAKTIVLQLSGMDDTDARKLVEDKLIGLPGVVSFTFDMKLGRVIVRARDWIKAESLCQTIASTATVSARQVVKSEAGEEIMLSFGSSPTKFDNGSTKTQTGVPQYLDEEDEHDPEAEKKAVAPQKGTEAYTNWFSNVGSYLAKTFYW